MKYQSYSVGFKLTVMVRVGRMSQQSIVDSLSVLNFCGRLNPNIKQLFLNRVNFLKANLFLREPHVKGPSPKSMANYSNLTVSSNRFEHMHTLLDQIVKTNNWLVALFWNNNVISIQSAY
ncbi:hypothetical protein BDF20DRAFT_97665 [Mycotypha africana]|uniref:uncharacterized protein n=1 Tax=Mycotypha africana TaxID=64632 RepID=UPI002300FE46|nr:uncharacterized protein BDF20DRAFT_97665 [Mycotypha africana]KAI8969980.1 hypothetical protein BDF20DRAFT_97665 [Mycotypha africana]